MFFQLSRIVILKGMTGALAPFSYLVIIYQLTLAITPLTEFNLFTDPEAICNKNMLNQVMDIQATDVQRMPNWVSIL
jgi:hypothetical protein